MRIFFILFLVASLTGCSANRIWYGSDVARLSFVRLTGVVDDQGNVTDVKIQSASSASEQSSGTDKHLGALIAWSPEFNAAFISRSGHGCIQPATYSKTNSGNAAIPAELISKGVASGSLTGDFSQALDKLISVSDQSTFLSIGVYGLCQMHANGGLTQEQLTQLTKVLFEKAVTLKGSVLLNGPENNTEVSEGSDPADGQP